jgi:putative membrane protein
MMTGYGMGFGGFGFIFIALFWIVVIAGGIWLLSNLFPKNSTSPSGNAISDSSDGSESAVDILKQRYARGELTKEEYDAMRYDLES